VILTDREIQLALEKSQIFIDPLPIIPDLTYGAVGELTQAAMMSGAVLTMKKESFTGSV
jgi:hypothetical protein